MMDNEDGHGCNTFHYNQQDMTMMLIQQQPLITTFSATLDPAYNNPSFHIPPTLSYRPYGWSIDPDDHQYMMMSSNLTDDQKTLFATSLNGCTGFETSSSLLSNMLSHEFEKMKSLNMIEDKALAASRSHSEAERRRRERINSHLTTLRSLLPNTTKTDKASLLAEVIHHVKELKQQTSTLPELNTFPTDSDELTFETCTTQNGQLLIKVSLCCDDRSDILQDLIKTCQDLNLKTVKADITTVDGRMKYVVIIAGESDDQGSSETFEGNENRVLVKNVKEGFRSVMGRSFRKFNEKGSLLDQSLKRRRVKETV